MFALVDCNNFYVSCERVFNPKLENRPVVVLSNNDGCIISRSNEAKKLGIPMGAPFFKWKNFCNHHHVYVFSSNYELYGDMSQRVMTLLKEYHAKIEIYSIDEAFLHFKEVSLNEMLNLRDIVKQCTGIPISIGVSRTKTLAKLANYIAKNQQAKGVFLLDGTKQENYLANIPVEKIWGIGRNLAEKLKALNIDTVKKLRDANPKMLRLHFSVNLEKVVMELNGTSCLALEKNQLRKQIISSRSFGKSVTELTDLQEAVSHYTARAAVKLRNQHSVAAAIYVFLETHLSHKLNTRFAGTTLSFSTPSADTRHLIEQAKKCLHRIYKTGYRYRKAGIILLDISSKFIQQQDMLVQKSDDRSERLMSIMDSINNNMGKNTIFIVAQGIQQKWSVKQEKSSSRYTTRWQELLTVIG